MCFVHAFARRGAIPQKSLKHAVFVRVAFFAALRLPRFVAAQGPRALPILSIRRHEELTFERVNFFLSIPSKSIVVFESVVVRPHARFRFISQALLHFPSELAKSEISTLLSRKGNLFGFGSAAQNSSRSDL